MVPATVKLKDVCSLEEKLWQTWWWWFSPSVVSNSCDPMDCSPPGSSVHGIFQARILEWLPFPSPGDLPDPGIEPRSPALQADFFPTELWGNPMTNLDSILKSKDIILPTKVYIVKPMVFPVVTYGCENWTVKKAERWKTDFKLQCWRRLFRVPWTTGRSNQSVLKEINPEYSMDGLMLKIKLQYFGHLMQRANSME